MIDTLYISTVDYDWNGSASVLVNRYNIDTIVGSAQALDCHTSVEDLYCENIATACNNANKIVLVNIDKNIKITNDNCFSYGRLLNELGRHPEKIKKLNWNKKFDSLKNVRSLESPVLWTAGCSVTAGSAIARNERWGSLLSSYMNLPEITLSQGGSSIVWAADQILRSDIQEGDVVVWGLTNIPRIEVSRDWDFESITISKYASTTKEYQYWNLDYFESETQSLVALRNILQVINFCQKVKATLYLANILDIAWIGVMLKDFKNFIDLTQDLVINGNAIKFIDVGSDNQHPGPRQHQQYATKIYNFIKENNHGNYKTV
jgi:hypothetical protein